MKFKNLLLVSASLAIFGACSDDDLQIDIPETDTEQPDEEQPDPENSSPAPFSLITLDNGAVDVDLNPVLTWSSTTDPDGDEVTYKLLLDVNESPETMLAEGLTTTEFSIAKSLQRNKVYYWKVAASDGSKGETESTETFSFSTKGFTMSDSALTTSTEFSSRRDHTLTEFDGKLWAIGGKDDSSSYGDVWSSIDGKTWQLEAEDPFGFFSKTNHTAIVFNNKLWVIAGGFSDVWSSSNGKDWTRENGSAGFGAREGHSTIVYDNKLWVIGGTVGSTQKNDVWYSENGITWSQAAASTQFSPRTDHSTVVFDGKMYLMGGTSVQDFSPSFYNDVYTSTDGVNWTEVATETVFEIRANHASFVHGQKIWIIGGWQAVTNQETFAQDIVTFRDVWYSEDGKQWSKLTVNESFHPRMGTAATVYDDKIIISGGLNIDQLQNKRTHYNDIWVIE